MIVAHPGILASPNVPGSKAHVKAALGRHGYHPRNVLGVWLFASQMGIHHATEVARACATDAALLLLLLSGGHARSAGSTPRRTRFER